MIVDPWGVVLAQAADREGFASADLDFTIQDEMRTRLPSLRHRRPEAYRWPDDGGAGSVRMSSAQPATAAGAP
jgi:predicted amidohydrolase